MAFKQRFINFVQHLHDAHPSIFTPVVFTIRILNKTLEYTLLNSKSIYKTNTELRMMKFKYTTL